MTEPEPSNPLNRDRPAALSDEERRRMERELLPTIAAWNAYHATFGCAADDYLEL